MKKFIVIITLATLGFYLGQTFYELGFGDARFEHGVKPQSLSVLGALIRWAK